MVKDWMKLIYKYESKDFFGTMQFREDFTYIRPDTVKKAFAAFRKDYFSSIEIDELFFKAIVIYWDSYEEYSNDIVSVKFYEHSNSCSIEKMAFTKLKKLIYGYMQEPEYKTA